MDKKIRSQHTGTILTQSNKRFKTKTTPKHEQQSVQKQQQ